MRKGGRGRPVRVDKNATAIPPGTSRPLPRLMLWTLGALPCPPLLENPFIDHFICRATPAATTRKCGG
jgi:hypothetical protein